MAWKKVIVSGSNAELANITATGTDIKLSGIPGATEANVVTIASDGTLSTRAGSDFSVTNTDTLYYAGGGIALSNTTFSVAAGTGLTQTTTGLGISNSGVGATQLAVDGDGTSGYVLSSDGDGTFSWVAQTVNTNDNTLYYAGTGLALSNTTFSVSNSGIGATQLDVDGNGSSGQVLASDGDGTFSWVAQTANVDTTYTGGTGITINGSDVISSDANQSHVTTVGALDAGSITSNFGAINNGSSNITTLGTISGSTIQTGNLLVSGSAQMSGSLIFNGVSFTETSISTLTGSNVFGGSSTTQTFSGSTTFINNPTFNTTLSASAATFGTLSVGGTAIGTLISNAVTSGVGTNITSVGTITTGTWNAGTIAVAYGGTNATSFADKSVIVSQDSGTDQLSAKAMTTDGSLLIGGGNGPEVATLTQGTNITITNGNGTISIAGTADTQLSQEQVEDFAGGLVATGGTKTGITVTYDDTNNNMDFVVGGLTINEFANATIQTSGEFSDTPTNNNTSLVTAAGIIEYVDSATSGFTGDTVYTAGDGLTLTGNDFDLEAGLTTVTSIYNTGLKIGRVANDTTIDFSLADDQITFDAGSTERLRVDTSGIKVYGAISASGNLTVAGNLQVNGTTTTVNTETINLADNFIVLNSDIDGNTAPVDAGITVNGGNASDQSLYYDFTKAAWSVYKGTGSDTTTATAQLVSVVATGSAPSGNPGYGNDANSRKGQMAVHGNDIYIYV